jgi:serine/threonine protein kinase
LNEIKSPAFNINLKLDSVSSKILNERKAYYSDDAVTEDYFTADQIKYYEKKFSDKKTEIRLVKEWKILEEIGRGSFGCVFSGFDTKLGRPIAIKQMLIMDKKKAGSGLDVLELEIDCLSSLTHQNIVAYYGSQKVDDKLNIFLEYVGGGSLETVINEYGSLSEKIIKKYTKQILEGLEYLHFKKIIHRDIKAANILVNKGVWKVTDFGASKQIIGNINAEKFKSFIGTPYWMSPEVITQQGHNRFADIWSLGCTVYEMLAGRPPWADINEFAAMNKIAKGEEPPKYPDTTSPELS